MSIRVDLQVAATICGVKEGTIYRWVSDGRITRHPDTCTDPWICTHKEFYDVDELLQWIDSRNPDALMLRAGMGGDAPTRMSVLAVAAKNRVRSVPE